MVIRDGLRRRCDSCGKTYLALSRRGVCSDLCADDLASGLPRPRVFGFGAVINEFGQPESEPAG